MTLVFLHPIVVLDVYKQVQADLINMRIKRDSFYV